MSSDATASHQISPTIEVLAILGRIGSVGLVLLSAVDLVALLRGSPRGPLPSSGPAGLAGLLLAAAFAWILAGGLKLHRRWAWVGTAAIIVAALLGIGAQMVGTSGTHSRAPKTDDVAFEGMALVFGLIACVGAMTVMLMPSFRRPFFETLRDPARTAE